MGPSAWSQLCPTTSLTIGPTFILNELRDLSRIEPSEQPASQFDSLRITLLSDRPGFGNSTVDQRRRCLNLTEFWAKSKMALGVQLFRRSEGYWLAINSASWLPFKQWQNVMRIWL
jgi:hypothetical protein